MASQLNQDINTSFPDWHRQPLRLSIAEMNKPSLVVDEFFQFYSLLNIRAFLKHWFADAIQNNEIIVDVHYTTYQNVEKLIEAVWLIHKHDTPPKKKNRSSLSRKK